MATDKIALMLEAERRGILPADKMELLNEARKRGLVQGSAATEPQPEQWQQTNPFDTPFMAGYGGDAYMGLKGIQQKGAQLGEEMGLVSPETVSRITTEGEEARTDLNTLRSKYPGARLGAFTSELASGLPVPGGFGKNLLMRMLTGAAAGTALGTSKFTGEGESTGKNALIGGVIGGGAPAIMSPIAKVYNALKGNVTKPMNLGAKQGIPTTLGEDVVNPHIQRAEVFMERIPLIGLKKFREEQYNKSLASTQDYVASQFMPAGSTETRGMLESNRKYVSTLYEKFKGDMAEFRDAVLKPKETMTESGVLIKRFPEVFESIQDTKVKRILRNVIGDTSGKSTILDQFGKKVETPQIKFDDMWELRKGLGDVLGQLKKKAERGDVNKEAYNTVSRLYSSVSKDMDNFAEGVGKPELALAFKTANDAYKQNVVKYNLIDRAMDKAMGQEVKDAVTGELVRTGKTFSPQRFSSELNKILEKEKYGNLFTNEEKVRMAGQANILDRVKRAGQFKENPPTGNRMIDVGIGGGAVGSVLSPTIAATVATTATGVSIAKFLTTTQAGKKFALAASNIRGDSPAMDRILDGINRAMRSATINEATKGFNLKNLNKKPQMGVR